MKNLLKSRLFIFGLLLRLGFLFFLGSHYLRDLFIPFLDDAVIHFGSNPWSLLPSHYFPYGTVLFSILYVPRLVAYALIGKAALGAGPIGLALVKGPLMIVDLGLFLLLRKLAADRANSLTWLYWLNPIVLFITYIHGQLDVVVMFFFFLSIFYLVRQRSVKSGLAMAAATLCKFHVVLAIPFILAYIWNRNFIGSAAREMGRWLAAWVVPAIIGFAPLIAAGSFFYASTSSPEAFRIFAAQLSYGTEQTLYLGVLIVLGTLGRLCLSTYISNRGLIFGTGAIFGALLLATDPMPGWFFWVTPFFALLFASQVNLPRSVFWVFNFAYLIHFALMPYLPESPMFSHIGFTVLQTALASLLVALFALVLKHETPVQRRGRPLLIGVAGDSGAGKNHLSGILQDIFNRQNTVVVEGDDYHKWERGNERWIDYTHLNPKANHLHSMAQHSVLLSKGIPVLHPQYDHSTGRFSGPRELKPSKAVIVQGLHSFYLRGMRRSYDLKVFLAPEHNIRLSWKLDRDVRERGHDLQKVLNSILAREEDAKIHIEPQRALADWVIEYFPRKPLTRDEILQGVRPEIAVRHTIWNDAPIGPLVDACNLNAKFIVKIQECPGSIDRICLEVFGEISSKDVAKVADAFAPLRHVTRGRHAPEWRDGYEGFTQLMTIALLSGVRTVGPYAADLY